MEERGHSSFHEGSVSPTSPTPDLRCKSLYTEWKSPAYYPFHSYNKTKTKSVSHKPEYLFIKEFTSLDYTMKSC